MSVTASGSPSDGWRVTDGNRVFNSTLCVMEDAVAAAEAMWAAWDAPPPVDPVAATAVVEPPVVQIVAPATEPAPQASPATVAAPEAAPAIAQPVPAPAADPAPVAAPEPAAATQA